MSNETTLIVSTLCFVCCLAMTIWNISIQRSCNKQTVSKQDLNKSIRAGIEYGVLSVMIGKDGYPLPKDDGMEYVLKSIHWQNQKIYDLWLSMKKDSVNRDKQSQNCNN